MVELPYREPQAMACFDLRLIFLIQKHRQTAFQKQVIVSLHNREYGLIRTNFPVAGADPTIHIYLQHGVATVVPTFPKQN